MQQRSQYHLILDRADPENPRWVVAKELASKPAKVPPDAEVDGRPTRWLGEFSGHEFAWLQFLFGRETFLRMTQPGERSYTTRLSPRHSPWSQYVIPACCQGADDDTDDHGADGAATDDATTRTTTRLRAARPGNNAEHGVWGHLHEH